MREKQDYAYVEVTYIVPVPTTLVEREKVFDGDIDFEYDILDRAGAMIREEDDYYYLQERRIVEWTTE